MPISHRIRSIRVDGGFLSMTVDHLASILDPVPGSATASDCSSVYSELLTFDLPASPTRQAGDPETILPAIDRLEDFHPDGYCLYRRVLVPVRTKKAIFPAWQYVVGSAGPAASKSLQAESGADFPLHIGKPLDSNCQ